MTLIAGIRLEKRAVIVADSAVTWPTRPSASFSSFGQFESNGKHGTVLESHLKIRQRAGCAMAFAGDVERAQDAIESTFHLIDRGDRPDTAFRSVCAGRTPVDPSRTSQLVQLSWNQAEDSPRLLAFNAEHRTEVAELDQYVLVMLGSANLALKWLIFRMGAILWRLEAPDDARLAAFLSLLSSLGLQHDLMNMGIGGAFCGCQLDSAGPRWHDDICYVLVDDTLKAGEISVADMVLSYVRDGGHIVQSSIINSTRVFLPSMPSIGLSEWAAKHIVKGAGDRGVWPRYLAVLHAQRPKVLLVELQEGRHVHASIIRHANHATNDGVVLDVPLSGEAGSFMRERYNPFPPNEIEARLAWAPSGTDKIAKYVLAGPLRD